MRKKSLTEVKKISEVYLCVAVKLIEKLYELFHVLVSVLVNRVNLLQPNNCAFSFWIEIIQSIRNL